MADLPEFPPVDLTGCGGRPLLRPDGAALAVTTCVEPGVPAAGLRLFDLNAWSWGPQLGQQAGWLAPAAWSPDGRRLYALSQCPEPGSRPDLVQKGLRSCLWVIEPAGADGFLHRFLAARGPGVHHVTFKVASLAEAAAGAEAQGYRLVGRDESDPDWLVAYLHPKEALGIVVQLGQSGGRYGRRPWEVPAGPPSPPSAVRVLGLRTRAWSAERARLQWERALGGVLIHATERELILRWPPSPMRIVAEIAPDSAEGPVAIDLGVTVRGQRADSAIRLRSQAFGEAVELGCDGTSEHAVEGWGRYVAAVALLLDRQGRPRVGFEGVIESSLPPGAGLSSSAALDVAVAVALCRSAGFELAPIELARLAREAELLAAGVPCGLMDPATVAKTTQAQFTEMVRRNTVVASIFDSTTQSGWHADPSHGSGTVTVTSLSASGASGTFSLTLEPTPHTSATGTMTLVGSFTARF